MTAVRAWWWRAAALAAAAAAAGVALVSPLSETAEERLDAHMLQHVLLGDLAPALLLAALAGLPSAATRLQRVASVITPLRAFAVWAAALAAWHLPVAYDAAVAREGLHLAQHASFAVGGLLAWSVLIDPARLGYGTGHRLALGLAMFVAGQVLATTLVLAEQPLYPGYGDGPGALGRQDAAGLTMMAEQALTLGVFSFFAVRRHLAEARPPALAEGEERHPLVV